ncbi:MAG: cupin domain-containing protein [Alistipes sp.]|nr:cupin domain-containing protein [Alistipes sp.]
MKKTILIPLLLLAFGGCTHNTSATMERPFAQIFPQGEKLPEQFSQYFIGQAYLARLTADTTLNCPIANVTFEPGCRNNWHSHTGGQILVATAGRGYYQEQGKPARELHPGDVVEIPADVIHWHGAAPDSWFSHLAIEANPQTNRNTWLGPVDDEQYAEATTARD